MRLPAFLATSIAIAAFAMLLQPAEARCCRCNFGKVSVNASCHTVTGTACQAGVTACAPGEVKTPPTGKSGSGEKPVSKGSEGTADAAAPAEEPQPVVEETQPAVEETQPAVEEQQPVVEEQQPVVEEPEPVVEEPEVPAEKPVGTTSEGAADEETNN